MPVPLGKGRSALGAQKVKGPQAVGEGMEAEDGAAPSPRRAAWVGSESGACHSSGAWLSQLSQLASPTRVHPFDACAAGCSTDGGFAHGERGQEVWTVDGSPSCRSGAVAEGAVSQFEGSAAAKQGQVTTGGSLPGSLVYPGTGGDEGGCTHGHWHLRVVHPIVFYLVVWLVACDAAVVM